MPGKADFLTVNKREGFQVVGHKAVPKAPLCRLSPVVAGVSLGNGAGSVVQVLIRGGEGVHFFQSFHGGGCAVSKLAAAVFGQHFPHGAVGAKITTVKRSEGKTVFGQCLFLQRNLLPDVVAGTDDNRKTLLRLVRVDKPYMQRYLFGVAKGQDNVFVHCFFVKFQAFFDDIRRYLSALLRNMPIHVMSKHFFEVSALCFPLLQVANWLAILVNGDVRHSFYGGKLLPCRPVLGCVHW